MTWIQHIERIVNFTSNLVEIAVGVIALYVTWTQRHKISAALKLLFNYSLLTTLSDLKHLLENLDEHSSDVGDGSKKFRKSLAQISGKIKGNPTLYNHFGDKMLKRIKVMIEDLDDNKTVNETSKISLSSEIKESLRDLEIKNHSDNSKKYE